MPGRNVTYQYSLAFKQKVVSEIESGKYSVGEARRIYDIKGPGTKSLLPLLSTCQPFLGRETDLRL
jgi:hypothetical protein